MKFVDIENSNELELGDVVRLKSGGPLMTIQSFGSVNYYKDNFVCVYFDNQANYHKQSFNLFMLVKMVDDNDEL